MSKESDGEKVICQVSGLSMDKGAAVWVGNLRTPLLALLKKKCPNLNTGGYISGKEYNRLLSEYVEDVLEKDKGELSRIEDEVVRSIEESQVLARNINLSYDKNLTIGEKLADRIAEFGGSWTFIIFFFLFLLVWMGLNVFVFTSRPFDPYPFILLNLILSSLAAVQAPIIMMSQNRVEAKDRIRAEHDYQINLKAELEIRSLHEKMDHLLLRQMQHLSEIQQIQIDLLNKIQETKK